MDHSQQGSRASTMRTYGEVVHDKAVEEMDVGISQIAQIDVLLNWRPFRLQLLEAWES